MILVTGATGTIGSSTVKALKAKSAKFKVGVRSPEKAKGLGVETVLFDWDKPETFGPALQGVEKVFLLTPTSDKQDQYAKSLVDAAKTAGVKHIVKLSVIGVDAEPNIYFGRQHKAAEKAMKDSGRRLDDAAAHVLHRELRQLLRRGPEEGQHRVLAAWQRQGGVGGPA